MKDGNKEIKKALKRLSSASVKMKVSSEIGLEGRGNGKIEIYYFYLILSNVSSILFKLH